MSLEEIAAMKIKAICNRGCKEDFYDIYHLLDHFILSEILKMFSVKYTNTDSFFAEKSLVYFEDADLEPNPNSIIDLSWNDVKFDLKNRVNRLRPE
mgnify:CR=1 FL=1|jgi:predicted nucleotidyltransferase component of viral defense system